MIPDASFPRAICGIGSPIVVPCRGNSHSVHKKVSRIGRAQGRGKEVPTPAIPKFDFHGTD
ncbi:hypothetical protein GCM10010187_08320 [Actinomadura coerulea]|nr:hypothetical protein GCM10010187_08320 [Actinomadura coerulea]